MLKVGGIWVSPIEVENTLLEHEAVLEAAVVGAGGQRCLDQAQGLCRPATGLYRLSPTDNRVARFCENENCAL